MVSVRSTPLENGRPDESTYYLLFETFERNARKHELLRVAMSNGNCALEGTYSHDEIVFGNGFTSGAGDVSCEMRAVICGGEQGTVLVRADSNSPQGYAVVIRLRSTTSEIRLELKTAIGGEVFVDRIMSYMKHVETQLHSDQERLQSREKKRDMLQKRVEQAISKKQEEDLKLETGMRILMKEKRNYWKGRA